MANTTTNDDVRLTQADADAVLTQGETDLNASNETYDGMISKSDSFYKDQSDAVKTWADTQTKIQNENTDFAIEQIEQQKGQAKQDYTKEQSGAYVDWQKESNQYGVGAEQRASMGMSGTGYSESSQVSMYNTYQNRVASARTSFQRAILNYDNAIKDARLQNNAALAQIAAEALEKQLAIALEGFQYKNTLLIAKADAASKIKAQTHAQWMDVLNQINEQNAMDEAIRHNQATEKAAADALAETVRHNKAAEAATNRSIALDEEKFAWTKSQASSSGSSGGSSSGGSSGGSIKKTSSKNKNNAIYKGKRTIQVQKGDGLTPTSKSTKPTNNTSDNGPTIDMNSVLALGYGPISASKLDQLCKAGKVVKYVEGNKIKFRPSINGR